MPSGDRNADIYFTYFQIFRFIYFIRCFRIESKHEVNITGGLNEFNVKFYGPSGSELKAAVVSDFPRTINLSLFASVLELLILCRLSQRYIIYLVSHLVFSCRGAPHCNSLRIV